MNPGGGLAVIAGSLYTVGGLSRGGLSNATSTDELAAARSKVNILAMSAGVAAAGAVGIGVTAFVGADGGHVGLNFRFREWANKTGMRRNDHETALGMQNTRCFVEERSDVVEIRECEHRYTTSEQA